MNSSLRHVDLTRAFRALRCYYQYIIQGWSHIVMFSCTTGYLLLESYPWKLSCLCTLQSNESRSLLPDGEIQWCIKRCAVSTTLSVQLMVNLQVTDFYCVHDQAFNLFPFFYKLIPRFLGSVQYQITDDVKMWSQQKKVRIRCSQVCQWCSHQISMLPLSFTKEAKIVYDNAIYVSVLQ